MMMLMRETKEIIGFLLGFLDNRVPRVHMNTFLVTMITLFFIFCSCLQYYTRGCFFKSYFFNFIMFYRFFPHHFTAQANVVNYLTVQILKKELWSLFNTLQKEKKDLLLFQSCI